MQEPVNVTELSHLIQRIGAIYQLSLTVGENKTVVPASPHRGKTWLKNCRGWVLMNMVTKDLIEIVKLNYRGFLWF